MPLNSSNDQGGGEDRDAQKDTRYEQQQDETRELEDVCKELQDAYSGAKAGRCKMSGLSKEVHSKSKESLGTLGASLVRAFRGTREKNM